MRQATVRDYESWHAQARELLIHHIAPVDVAWNDERDAQPMLRGVHEGDSPVDVGISRDNAAARIVVPRKFVERARIAALHRSHVQWALLYRMLWRITHGERELLADPLDADLRLLDTMVGDVRRDEHTMHAFVRFRKLASPDGERYVAFHRPDHHIVQLTAPFFVERFRTMQWSILTPDECAHWDGESLSFAPGVDASAAPAEDAIEDVWRTYYASIFNPARINPRAMVRELPVRHWATLPEARIIPALVAQAPARLERMLTETAAATSARPFIPASATTLAELHAAATQCTGCALYRHATQVVFGAGPVTARIMLVGEQPGDEEDVRGEPFVGPAGQVLSDAMQSADLDRSRVYVTNAVKHFTFRREGKRRIHERPRIGDVRACRPWLEAEIHQVKPDVIVCLGSTAAHALIGPQVRIQRDRGTLYRSAFASGILPTYHPSAVLRADPEHARDIFQWLVTDLKSVAARYYG